MRLRLVVRGPVFRTWDDLGEGSCIINHNINDTSLHPDIEHLLMYTMSFLSEDDIIVVLSLKDR